MAITELQGETIDLANYPVRVLDTVHTIEVTRFTNGEWAAFIAVTGEDAGIGTTGCSLAGALAFIAEELDTIDRERARSAS